MQQTHGLRRNQKSEIRNVCTWKTQRMHQFYSLRACVAFLCVRALRFFYLCCWPACVASVVLHTAAWKPTFKSVCIGLQLHTVSKLLYATQAMQRMQHNGRMACDAIKNQNTQRMHAKNTTHALILLCVHCVFRHFLCAYIACIALRTTAWKSTFKSVFCILMATALFLRSARVCQPAIGKFLFMTDEQFVKFDDRRWSGI